jgi:carboxymethylenebutenolidase
MERKKASDFPQELLDLFDGYVHGGLSRRDFLDGAQKFAVGGVTATALFEMLKPNYAWAIQVQPDDKRINSEIVTVPSRQRREIVQRGQERSRSGRGETIKGSRREMGHERRGCDQFPKDGLQLI